MKKKVDFKESRRFLEQSEKGESQLLALQEVRMRSPLPAKAVAV